MIPTNLYNDYGIDKIDRFSIIIIIYLRIIEIFNIYGTDM